MKRIIKQLLKVILLKVITEKRIVHILKTEHFEKIKFIFNEHGYEASRKLKMPVDKFSNPIPWFTYPAIEYLNQLNLKEKTIFEWGCGNSTLYFSSIAQHVFSVEDNKEWFEKINKLKNSNQTIIFAKDDDYVNAIKLTNQKFDIILIDASHRFECTKIAANYLKEGGLIILDNSNWYTNSVESLKLQNFIQIDFHGFGPINPYTWTTSFFFSRDYNFPYHNIHSLSPTGGTSNLAANQ